jgi:hypothetical protein
VKVENDFQPTLSRRYLKCFACGIAHKFACSVSHYAWLAHHYGISRITIDLLNLTITPAEFDIRRNRNLAEMCRDNLLRNFRDLKPPASVASAVLIADFGIQNYARNEHSEWLGKSVFTVILTDDRGKDWRAENHSDHVLAQGGGFGDPNR